MSEARRVLLVNPNLGVGGVERKLADIACYLARNGTGGAYVELLLEQARPDAEKRDVFFDIVRQSPVQIRIKPQTRLVPFFCFLLWHILRTKPSVIFAFSRRPCLWTLTLTRLLPWQKIRVLCGNDTLASYDLDAYVHNRATRRVLAAWMRRVYPKAALFVVPSDASKRDLSENFRVPAQKIRVIKNWTRLPSPAAQEKQFDLVYVGRVEPVKNLAGLIEIVGRVRRSLPGVRAAIVGDGSDMANIKHIARQQELDGAIEFVGYQKEPGPYLAASRIFCLTSDYEALPIAVLEAMAYSLPVVTVAYPGAQEIVQQGKTGYICADEQEYAAQIIRLLTDEKHRIEMGERARQLVQAEHGEAKLAEFVRLFLP